MKKKLKSLLLFVSLIFPLCFIACDDDDDDTTTNTALDLIVDNNSVTLLQGDEIQVKITSGNGDYFIKSVDENIATASVSDQVVTIKAPKTGEIGETTILVVDGRKKVAQIKVKVAKLWDLTVDNSNVNLFIDASAIVKIETGNGGYKLALNEGGEEIIELGELSGQVFLVKALKIGTATVTITDKKDQIAEVTITVNPADLELSSYEVALANPTATSTIDILGGNGGYTFSSNPEGIASASVSGTVITLTAHAIGATIITVTDQQGETKDIQVTVKPYSLTVDVQSLDIVGSKASHVINVTSGNGGYISEIVDTDIASASVADNVITVQAKKLGSTTLKLKDAHDQEISVSVTISSAAMKLGLDYCMIANYGALANSNDYKNLSQVTMEVRVKLDDTRGLQGFIGLEGNLLIRGARDGAPQQIELVSKLSGTEKKMVTQPIMDKNKWYHLALVFDGTLPDVKERHKLYVNGELYTDFVDNNKEIDLNRTTIDLTATSNAPGLGIGRVGSNYWRGLNGVIAEARVWTVARTATQIKNGVCALNEQNPIGLLSHWVFDYGADTSSVTDLTGKCDAVVYDNKGANDGQNVTTPKTFPAGNYVATGCPN